MHLIDIPFCSAWETEPFYICQSGFLAQSTRRLGRFLKTCVPLRVKAALGLLLSPKPDVRRSLFIRGKCRLWSFGQFLAPKA
jgi:hypothetical protein